MVRKFFLTTFLLALLFLPAGCIVVGLGAKGRAAQNPTLGMELMDLKKALDQESITKEEYLEAKGRLLEKMKKQ